MRITRSVPGLSTYTPYTQLTAKRAGMAGLGATSAPADSVVTTATNILSSAENFVRDNPRTILGLVAFLLFK